MPGDPVASSMDLAPRPSRTGAVNGPAARPLRMAGLSAHLAALLLLLACAPAAPSWLGGAEGVQACQGGAQELGAGRIAATGGLLRLRGGRPGGGVKARELWDKVVFSPLLPAPGSCNGNEVKPGQDREKGRNGCACVCVGGDHGPSGWI